MKSEEYTRGVRDMAEARIAEANLHMPEVCSQHRPLRSPLCSRCQKMARWEERIAALTKARDRIAKETK